MRIQERAHLGLFGHPTNQRGQVFGQVVVADDTCCAVHPAIAWAHDIQSTYAKLETNRVILPRPAGARTKRAYVPAIGGGGALGTPATMPSRSGLNSTAQPRMVSAVPTPRLSTTPYRQFFSARNT